MFRHAERENSGSSNPPLNRRGLDQAQKILQEIDLTHLPRPTKLFSSPKLRAQQTFHPLQDKLGVPLQLHPELDERHNFESAAVFSRRVQHFLNSLENMPGVIYFVSHLDWLEEAVHLIHADTDMTHSKFQTWMPAQCLEFDVQERLWHFQTLRQFQV